MVISSQNSVPFGHSSARSSRPFALHSPLSADSTTCGIEQRDVIELYRQWGIRIEAMQNRCLIFGRAIPHVHHDQTPKEYFRLAKEDLEAFRRFQGGDDGNSRPQHSCRLAGGPV